jgi:hypothetical protein
MQVWRAEVAAGLGDGVDARRRLDDARAVLAIFHGHPQAEAMLKRLAGAAPR